MFSFATENEFSSNNVNIRVNEGWTEGRNESEVQDIRMRMKYKNS